MAVLSTIHPHSHAQKNAFKLKGFCLAIGQHPSKRENMEFHLHLVSDSTGETVNSAVRACLVQFEGARAMPHLWNMVRTPARLTQVVEEIEAYPGLVVYTLADTALQTQLVQECEARQIPCVSLLAPVLQAIEGMLGQPPQHRPGRQHELDEAYYHRIAAMEFSLAHDDGQNLGTLHEAEIVLVGVSRTSKSPTCLYLANRGLFAANVPLVPGIDLPAELLNLKGPLIVGLTHQPERLIELRRTRLGASGVKAETAYVDFEAVEEEVKFARRIIQNHGWPLIDVSRRAIEETAAEILMLHSRFIGRSS